MQIAAGARTAGVYDFDITSGIDIVPDVRGFRMTWYAGVDSEVRVGIEHCLARNLRE